MTLFTARAVSFGIALAVTVGVDAAALEFRPIDGNPSAVSALGSHSEIEAFALAPASSTAVVSTASAIRYAHGAGEPRTVPLSGKVAGLALLSDGTACYAIVRVSGKNGALRSVELVRIDLRTARTSSVARLPTTAAGLAITSDDATLLVASKDEVRTFSIPAVASGRLYRVAGDNVGVSPIDGTSFAVVAQRSRVALVDLAAPQGRDGLLLQEEAIAPSPLKGLLASAGEGGPVALADDGRAWRVYVGDLPAIPVVTPPPPPPPEPEPQPPEPQPPEPTPAAPAADPPKMEPAPRDVPGEPGTVAGVLTGPAMAEVAAVVFLGPDNILREAVRVKPDGSGHYEATALPAGAYRIVAAGKEGRVLICQPVFLSIRVGSNSAVEAPELSVIRAE